MESDRCTLTCEDEGIWVGAIVSALEVDPDSQLVEKEVGFSVLEISSEWV